MKSLGARIRWARERSGLTQAELAGRVDVTAGSRVSEWENDRRQPSAPVLMTLPGVLEISGHWLLTGEGPRVQTLTEGATEAMLEAIQRISRGEIPVEVIRMLADPSASAYLSGARRVHAPRLPEPAVPTAIVRRRWLAARIEHHETPYYLDFESSPPAPSPVERGEPGPEARPGEPRRELEPGERGTESIYEDGYVWGHLAH